MGTNSPEFICHTSSDANYAGTHRGRPTCESRPVAVSSKLSHDSDAVRSRLSHLRTRVTQRLHQGPQEVLGVFEGRRAAVFDDVIEYAQTPLSVRPGSMRTLSGTQHHKHSVRVILQNCPLLKWQDVLTCISFSNI